MNVNKKAHAAGLGKAVAEVLEGPVYLAYCICWFVTIAVSLFTAVVWLNQNSLSLTIVVAVSLAAMIIPFALLKLRRNRNSAIVRRFASYIKAIYISEWIGLAFLILLLLLFAIAYLLGGNVRAEMLEVIRDDSGTIISMLVSLAVIPPNLVFHKRFIKMLKETASILDGKPEDAACFQPAVKAALLAVFAQIVWSCMYIATRGNWISALSVVQAVLLWLVLRDAATKAGSVNQSDNN